jgi:site-specific recombinase XerD
MNPQTAFDLWIATYRRRRASQNTIIHYTYVCKRFIARSGCTDLATLNDSHIDQFTDSLFEVGNHTLHKHLTIVRTWLTWCHRHDYTPFNPADIRLPYFTPAIREPMNLDDLTRLLSYLPANKSGHVTYVARRDNLVWHFCSLAGMRIHEVTSLHVQDVTQQGILIHQAKGHKSRVVPAVPRLQQAITDYMPYLHWKLNRAPAPEDMLFPGTNYKNQPVSAPYLWVRFEDALQALGLQGYTFHSLRHTYATMLLRAKVDLPVLQKLLGHSSITSTMIYLHTYDDQLDEAAMRHPLAQVTSASTVPAVPG